MRLHEENEDLDFVEQSPAPPMHCSNMNNTKLDNTMGNNDVAAEANSGGVENAAQSSRTDDCFPEDTSFMAAKDAESEKKAPSLTNSPTEAANKTYIQQKSSNSVATVSTLDNTSETVENNMYTVFLTTRMALHENRRMRGYRFIPADKPYTPEAFISADSEPVKLDAKLITASSRVKRESKPSASQTVLQSQVHSPSSRGAVVTPSSPMLRSKNPVSTITNKRPNRSSATSASGEALSNSALQFQYSPDGVVRRIASLTSRLAELNRLKDLQRVTSITTPTSSSRTSVPTQSLSVPIGSKSSSSRRRFKTQTPLSMSNSSFGDSLPATPGSAFAKRNRKPKSPQLSDELKRVKVIVTNLMKHSDTCNPGGVFNTPVNCTDPEKPLFAPSYREVIGGSMMDLGTLRRKLLAGHYSTIDSLVADAHIISSNAVKYNAPGTKFHDAALALRVRFDNEIARLREGTYEARISSNITYCDDDWGFSSEDDGSSKKRKRKKPKPAVPKHEHKLVSVETTDNQIHNDHEITATANADEAQIPEATVSQDLSNIPLSQREKTFLKSAIMAMDEERVYRVIEIVRLSIDAGTPNEDEEYELDIDALSVQTLRQLQAYVSECQLQETRSPNANTSSPSLHTNGDGDSRLLNASAMDIEVNIDSSTTVSAPEAAVDETPALEAEPHGEAWQSFE